MTREVPRLTTTHDTERLRLRELTHDDAAFVLELVNDPAWLRFIGDRDVHTLEAARGYVDRVRRGSYEAHGFGLWAVDLRQTGETLGICGLLRRDTLPVPDLGFAFLERHRGRGYAREAAAACVALARTRWGLGRLCAISSLDNTGSHRVLEGAGFARRADVSLPGSDEVLALHERLLA